ncbi:MAG: amidohydrolase family protein [Armatimonadetes bacterium]|nr:amidohydrolase family protein [Armatimonadota bacterium]
MFIPRPIELNGRRLVVHAGTLIDGTGHAPAARRTLIAQGNEIREIIDTTAYREVPGDVVVDGRARVVMPGIIDAHVHVRSSGDPAERAFASFETTIPTATLKGLRNAWRDLEYGVTTIRDLAAIGYMDVALRDAISGGEFSGPRMFVAGHGLTMHGGHMDPRRRPEVELLRHTGLTNTPDEVKAAARYQISRGVDLIKFNTAESRMTRDGQIWWPQEMDYEMIRAGVIEAEKVGIHSAAHCHGGQGATDTIRAGVTSIEHGHWLTDEHFDLMNEHGTYFCPTLACNQILFDLGPEAAVRGLRGDPSRWEWLKRVIHDKADTMHRAMRKGVRIVNGSDAGTAWNFHGECIRELAYLVDYGMKPMNAIVAATKIAAELLRVSDKLGTLQVGKWADFLVVEGDPLADMRVLTNKENIKLVVKDGVPLVDRMDLEASAARVPAVS